VALILSDGSFGYIFQLITWDMPVPPHNKGYEDCAQWFCARYLTESPAVRRSSSKR